MPQLLPKTAKADSSKSSQYAECHGYRVLTLVDGMKITHERRAGVATSFIDPLLMGGVDILRGPASTYYGSGALGGVVQIFPRRFEGLSIATGWESYGNETYQLVGWGDGTWSVGLARRDVDGR